MGRVRIKGPQKDRKSGYYNLDLETMPKSERLMYQNKLLADFISHAYQYSTAIKKRFDKYNINPKDISSLTDLQRLPTFNRHNLRELQKNCLPFGGLLATNIHEIDKIFVSPGPIYDPEGKISDYWHGLKALYTMGFRRGDLVQNCFSYHLGPGGSMLEKSLLGLGCKVIPMGPGNRELQVRVMRDLSVIGYTGNPSFFIEILDTIEAMNLKIPGEINLEIAYLAGEILDNNQRHDAEFRYGIMIRQAYGTGDAGFIAYECGFGNGMHVDERVILEIIDPETEKPLPPGQKGEVVVTVMRKQYPLIRMNLGDIGIWNDEPCGCGRTSPRLMQIFGRSDQSVRVKGIFLHPWELDEMARKIPELGHYQLVITKEGNIDKLIFRAEWKEKTPEKQKSALIKLENYIKEDLRLKAKVELVSGDFFLKKYKVIDDRRETIEK
jgi:phenylacetate-CoA ligase